MNSQSPISQFPQDMRVVAPNDSGTTAPNANFGPINANMILVGAVGDVSVMLPNNDSVVIPNVAAGVWLWVPGFKHVNLTGTEPGEILIGIAYA